MKKKYVIHPASYAIGETEKLYGDMAARGWLLKKRGAFLSRFDKAEPHQLRYRIELSSPEILNGEAELPDEQLALYEECGWRYVTGRVWIHVFSAPEGSGTPEIYTDPRQQTATLKVLRRQYLSWITSVMILIPILLIAAMHTSSGGSVFGTLINALKTGWIVYTAIYLLYAFAALWGIYATLRGAVFTAKLHRRLKRGQPIDHAPKRGLLPHRIVSVIMLCCCVTCVVLTAVQWAKNEKYDMPYEADGPYLLLKDLGWNGARAQMFTGLTSYVETKHSLLADQWNTYECVSTSGGNSWMYQHVYTLRNKTLVRNAVPLLMVHATFTREISGFTRVNVAGLDEAYKGHMEYIAVKGTTLYFITYFDQGVYSEQGTQVDVLAKLAGTNR